MNAIFFSILAIFSLFVFMNLGKIKASKKQMDRNDRIKWGNRRRKSFFKNRSSIQKATVKKALNLIFRVAK